MPEVSDSISDRAKVWELIKEIGVAHLVTQDSEGRLRGRPVAATQKDFSGDLYFMSREGTAKLGEILGNDNVLLAYEEPKKQSYVSISGKATILRDRAKIKDLWSPALKIWFPDGPDDPQICLICVHVDSAEYWDSSTSSLVYAMHYVKASVTGKPSGAIGENKIVNF